MVANEKCSTVLTLCQPLNNQGLNSLSEHGAKTPTLHCGHYLRCQIAISKTDPASLHPWVLSANTERVLREWVRPHRMEFDSTEGAGDLRAGLFSQL
jgi:hypothetical protein